MAKENILNTIGREDGMTVPEGYFNKFNEQMIGSLPEMEWEKPHPQVMPRTFWQKVRPYVYMAAMFAGIWCMMKTFDMMRTDTSTRFEPSSNLISAVNNDAFVNDFIMPDISDASIYDELYNEGVDPEDLDF